MKSYIEEKQLIAALNNRYAVKQFEKRSLPKADLQAMEESVMEILRLTPTSYGLEAYKFIFVEDEEKRKKLKEASWGQTQITDSDLLLVFTVPTNFSEKHIHEHVDYMAKIRDFDEEKTKSMKDNLSSTIMGQHSEGDFEPWLTKQAYIGLGNLMTGLALLGIDTCPMEGISGEKYNEILGLDEKNLNTKVVLTIGKRSSEDKYGNAEKVRFPKEKLFIKM